MPTLSSLTNLQSRFTIAPAIVLLFLILLPTAAIRANEKPTLMFTLHGQPEVVSARYANGVVKPDPLQRELARQAIIMTVREEFGLSTRDESLLEPIELESDHLFEIKVTSLTNVSVNIEMRKDDEEIFNKKVKLYAGWISGYFGFAGMFDRIRPEVIRVFEEQGYSQNPARPASPDDLATLPDEIEQLLLEMNHIAQWKALRHLHQAIRENGESVPRLSGLVRAYSNLAQLTFLTSDNRTYVFAARSILYSRRMAVASKNSLEATWAYGYACAILGFPEYTLRAYRSIDKAKDTIDVTVPEWAPLIDHYCYHRYESLMKEANKAGSATSQLAAVLAQKSAEHSFGRSFLVKTGLELSEVHPDCLWLTDSMVNRAGVSSMHSITRFQPLRHANQLSNHLGQISTLPKVVRALMEKNTMTDLDSRAEIANAFIAAAKNDSREPSMAVLGRGIEALNVFHTISMGRFLKDSLSVDSSSEIQSADFAIQNHPHAALIRTLGLRRNSPAKAYQKLVADYQYKDANWSTTSYLIKGIPQSVKFKNMTAGEAYLNVSRTIGGYESAFLHHFRQTTGKAAVGHADWMKKLSPNSPLRLATYMKYDFQNHREEVDIWLEENGQHPTVILAAGQAFVEHGDLERGIPLLNRYLKSIPDGKVFNQLAGLYFRQNKDDMWLETMNRIFDHEDYGLTHSHAAKRVASTLMNQGKFEAAETWARRAYRSGSYAGMQSLKDCLTAIGKYEEAEQIAQEQTLRYGMNSSDDCWFYWCLENEKGDLESATKLRQKRLNKLSLDPKLNDTMLILVEDDIDTAHDQLQANLAIRDESIEVMHLALVLDKLGQHEERDQTFKKLIELGKKKLGHPLLTSIAPLMLEYAKTDQIDDSALLEIAKKLNAAKHDQMLASIMYYFAVMQETRGKTKEAIANWKNTARNEKVSTSRILAWRKLRSAGIDPETLERRNFSDHFKR